MFAECKNAIKYNISFILTELLYTSGITGSAVIITIFSLNRPHDSITKFKLPD